MLLELFPSIINYKLRTVVLLKFRKCGLARGLFIGPTEREKLLLIIASLLREKSYCISDIL